MTAQQVILFCRSFGTKFLGSNQECLQENRKRNNTTVCLEAAPQKPLKNHVSMTDLKSIQTCQEDKESKESGHGNWFRPTYKTVTRREIKAKLEEKSQREELQPSGK